ncbi:MAG: hypothetical protein ACI915_002067 [Gammaproteobacteria bacterium]|jgi:hypothetical protein
MFSKQLTDSSSNVAFLEYAWDMAWCDLCAADPMTKAQLRGLGVFWVEPDGVQNKLTQSKPGPGRFMPQPQPVDVFVTRLHVRYDNENFPEDLMFVETGDRQNFQGRYVIRHPWQGKATCEAGKKHLQSVLPKRQTQEAQTLVNLTGWAVDNSGRNLDPAPVQETPWSENLWPKNGG